MFGGLTHEPAVALAELLVDVTPPELTRVFFDDSGSVAVEVAIEMALHYWQGRGRPGRNRLLTVRGGYHGDTAGAMSVCDPVTGMHGLFRDCLAEQVFVERPRPTYEEPLLAGGLDAVRTALAMHSGRLAAVIVEPVVQGAGGMRFYSPDSLRQIVRLCREAGLLVIFDEIATGFGRTGTLFAATLCTDDVAEASARQGEASCTDPPSWPTPSPAPSRQRAGSCCSTVTGNPTLTGCSGCSRT